MELVIIMHAYTRVVEESCLIFNLADNAQFSLPHPFAGDVLHL